MNMWLPPMALLLLLGVALFLFIKVAGALAPVHILEIISLTSNVMSYSRLMALGIASVAIADVANSLSRGAEALWVAIPLFVLIHRAQPVQPDIAFAAPELRGVPAQVLFARGQKLQTV